MPSPASPTMTSSTSLIISGSRAEVGSSNSIAIGSMASARAIATRCCWPPESWPGYLSLWSARPTRSRSARPLLVASSRLRPSTFTCARVRLRITVMCGNSSKFWNTMPILERSLGRSVFGSPTETPSIRISPFWNGSKPFTHLMSVDLPLPEGPHTTTTSPFFTSVEQPVSTWKLPYHLLTFFIEIMRVSPDDGDAFLQALHERRQAVGNGKIHDRHEGIHLDQAVVAVRDLRGGAQEIRGGDHVHERGVLEQDDRLREEHRQHVAEGLRQNDPPHRLPVVESERIAGPDLAARDRLDARAHDLAVIGRLEHGERDDARPERADLDRLPGADHPRPDVGHEEEEPEDNEHQRHRAHEIDVAAGRNRKRAEAREPHHGEERAENDAAGHRHRGQRDRERHPLPEEVGERALDDVEIESGIHGSMPRLLRGSGGDEAGNAHLPLEGPHEKHDDQVREQINHRRGRKGLEHAKAEFLHGARPAGQFKQPDGQRHRGVLDDVHEFGGERRQDDAESLRQDDVAVGLRWRQPHRGAR